MSKGASEKVSMELAFLAALDAVHADVDLSEIAEIHDWSRAVRGKFYGAAVKGTSRLSNPQTSVPPAIVTDAPASSSGGVSGVVLGTSGHVASYGSVQYSQMAIPQLITVCTSESSEGAWTEFIRRFQPFIAGVIAKVVLRYGNVSDVDDLVQETFLKLCHDNFRTLRAFVTARENAFQGLLKVVATRIAMDHFRSAASARRGAGEAPEADLVFLEHGSSRGASSELEREILFKEIDRILKTLAHEPNFERDYKIFWLYYRQGFTAKAIASLPGMELSVKGVESTLLRLTQQIKVALTLKDPKKAARNL